MTIEYIRYRIPQEQSEAFRAAYQRASESLRASAVCLGYELTVCTEEPTAFILRIHWTSMEEHLSVFRKSAQFPPFLQEIRPFIPNIEEMRHYELTDVAWSRAAS